jgi:hypothetical protein
MMEEINKKLNNIQKEILAGLYSANEIAVLQSVAKMHNHGGNYSIKPMLEIYFSTPFPAVRDAIYELMCNLKDAKTSAIIEQNIETFQDKENFAKFLSAIWQSAVKFDTLMPFLRILDNGDEMIAVEVLSIVEQSSFNISDSEREICIKFIELKLTDYQGFKKTIAENILEILK